MLAEGEIELVGRMPWSSNNTFLVELCLDDGSRACAPCTSRAAASVRSGTSPTGLHPRELAAYRLSEALGWRLVPETVVRDGPLGEGSLQRFVDADFSSTTSRCSRCRSGSTARSKTICTFDLLANNADRKGGHCLFGEDGQIWAIDHGLCFHAQPKLRTVIWDFGDQPVPERLLADVERFADAPSAELLSLLDDAEADALVARARYVVDAAASRPTPPAIRIRGRLSDGSLGRPSTAAPMSTNADLVELGDLDELIRQVDRLCDGRDWHGLVDLRDRCRRALERGKQLWPRRGQRRVPPRPRSAGRWAGPMIVPGVRRFAVGPAARGRRVHPHLGRAPTAPPAHAVSPRSPPTSGWCGARTSPRHRVSTAGSSSCRSVCSRGSPPTRSPTYDGRRANVADVTRPKLEPVDFRPASAGSTTAEACRALVDLVTPWTTQSNGRAEAVAVAGDGAPNAIATPRPVTRLGAVSADHGVRG